MKISENQRKVLEVLTQGYDIEDNCIYFFRGIKKELPDMETRLIRLACRALKRKGLAEHSIAWDMDGFVNGSGYMATKEGAMLINACKKCNFNPAMSIDDDNCWQCYYEK